MDANENGQGVEPIPMPLPEKDVSDRSNPSGKSSQERFPDFSKLERVQDLLERNKCVTVRIVVDTVCSSLL